MMGKDKQKRTPRRFRLNKRILGLIVMAVVVLLKRDAIQFRLHNLIDPVYGEIIFHSDPDGDGVPQLYHMTFNTAFRYSHVEPLTDLPAGARNGVYSPDGTRIVFQTGDTIALMNADGSDIQVLDLTDTNPYNKPEVDPLWISPTEIVFQRVIGSSSDEILFVCHWYAPFLLDLATQQESRFFQAPADIEAGEYGWLRFRALSRTQQGLCEYQHTVGSAFLPQNPTAFHPFFERVEAQGFLNEALSIAGKTSTLSPSGRRLARSEVYIFPDRPSGVELYIDGEWQTIQPVHGAAVSWSPDERFLVYDGLHPDGTSVLALTSVDGAWVYPLVGNDGISYFSPNWRP